MTLTFFQGLEKTMEDYRFTRVDTGSIMDELIEAPVLDIWAKEQSPLGVYRTVYEPSMIDQANIAFLHPGKSLNADLIEKHGKALDYDDDMISKLTKLFEAGYLAKVRQMHLDILEEQMDDWLDQLDQDVDMEVKKLLDKKLNAPKPPKEEEGADEEEEDVIEPDPFVIKKGPMCATRDDSDSSMKPPEGRAAASDPSILRAVTRKVFVNRRWDLGAVEKKPESKNYAASITYSFVPCPKSKDEPNKFILANHYRRKVVARALRRWQKFASFKFTLISHPAEDSPEIDDVKHISIVFQDYHYTTGKRFELNDDEYRSYTLPTTGVEPPPSDDKDVEQRKDYEASIPRKHTVCIRGVIEKEEEASQAAPDVSQTVHGKTVTKEMLMMRTILHEVCLVLVTMNIADIAHSSVIRLVFITRYGFL